MILPHFGQVVFSEASTFCMSIFPRGIVGHFRCWVKEKRRPFLLGFRTVRPVKLEFFDHPFTCPICRMDIVYTYTQTLIVCSTRLCPSCRGELLIQQGKIFTALADRKPPKREGEATPKRSRK